MGGSTSIAGGERWLSANPGRPYTADRGKREASILDIVGILSFLLSWLVVLRRPIASGTYALPREGQQKNRHQDDESDEVTQQSGTFGSIVEPPHMIPPQVLLEGGVPLVDSRRLRGNCRGSPLTLSRAFHPRTAVRSGAEAPSLAIAHRFSSCADTEPSLVNSDCY